MLPGTTGSAENLDNSYNEALGWAAHPTRKIESLFTIPVIQMGARVYLPALGRFLQVDPVLGGTPNAYVYVLDPVNSSDYSGMFAFVIPAGYLVVAAVGLALGYAVTTPAYREATSVVAGSVGDGVRRAYNSGLEAIQSFAKPRSDTKAPAKPKTQSRTDTKRQSRGYRLAPPPYAGVKFPGSNSNSFTAKAVAITSTVSALESGIKPGGFPIFGQGASKPFTHNPIYFQNWTKYSVPYPALGFEVHYSINEDERLYSDVKITSLY